MGRDGKKITVDGGGGGGGGRKKFATFCLQPLLHKFLTTKQQLKKHISKRHSKQAKTGEVERNYKMFANPVLTNPGRF